MTNVHLLRELDLLLNVGVHMLSLAGEHLLVQKCFMFFSSVCVKCSALVEDGREPGRRPDNSTVSFTFQKYQCIH